MRDYKNYQIWQRTMDFSTQVYNITRDFPKDERFGLISQLRRAAVSMPSNIAEGSARGSDKEFKRFISFSLGSLYEIESQLILSERFKFLDKATFKICEKEISEIGKMIISFMKKLD